MVEYIDNVVSARDELNGKLRVELCKNYKEDEIDRELAISIYDKNMRLVINTPVDIDILIAKLQGIRDEVF